MIILLSAGFSIRRPASPLAQRGGATAWQLRGDRRFRPELGTFDDLLLEIDKSHHDVILSSEDFECAADNLGSFISGLEQHGLKVEVIVYIRDQLSYARSLYLEMTKHGDDRTFSEFLSEVVEHHVIRWHDWVFRFNYCVLLSQLPPATTVIARPFSRMTSVINDFASISHLSPADLEMDPDYEPTNSDRSARQSPRSTAIALVNISTMISAPQ